jgi:multiple sugar transport system substrate-binding protein
MVLFMSLLAASLLNGCGGAASNSEGNSGNAGNSGAQQPAKEPVEDTTPVELTIYSHWLGNYNDFLNTIIAEKVKQKYPYITLNVLIGDAKNPLFDQLLAQGVAPDIIYAAQSYAVTFKDDYKAIDDLAPYIKKSNIDLNQFEPGVMNGIKSYSDKGEIFGLPLIISPWALYYNKDIFDKFGVTYPKDGLTWEQLIDLATKLTRSDGGTQYKGVVMQQIDKMAYQLSLPYYDQKAQKPAFESDGWKRLFGQMKQVWDIPGIFNSKADISAYSTEFEAKKIAAMVPNNNKIPNYIKEETTNGFNWDIAEFPSYSDKPNVYPAIEANTLMLDTASKHKDAAFKVISLMVSEDVGMAISKTAQVSALTSKGVQQAFGGDFPTMKSKHVEGIFKGHPAPLPSVSVYDADGLKALRAAWNEVLIDKKDINSALHDGSEMFQQAINAKKAQ